MGRTGSGWGLPGSLQRPPPQAPTAGGPEHRCLGREGGWHESLAEGTPSPTLSEPFLLLQGLGTGVTRLGWGTGHCRALHCPHPWDQGALKLHRKRGQTAGTRPGGHGSPQRHIVRDGRLRQRARWVGEARAGGAPRRAAGPAAPGWLGHAAGHSPAPVQRCAPPGPGSAPSAPPPPPGRQT